MPKKPVIAVVMGSDSDYPVMKETSKVLSDFGIPFEIKVLSAHRSPDLVTRFARLAKNKGLKVIIAGAGGAAHLAGVIASHTTLPVIGIPIESKYLKGIDSLFSTVQMPGGVPVSCMSIGRSGAKNAAISALQILALNDNKVQKRLELFKKEMVRTIKKKNRDLK
ncbi:5-(carboxyamino)imidazole ribonucleotide mutase [Omnitrophica bacterium]|nr:5-(carboxyamino)imidazole ribonucleotide mutase [Candidatus Omnitrophota bacterium]